jgi:hypothetical protein
MNVRQTVSTVKKMHFEPGDVVILSVDRTKSKMDVEAFKEYSKKCTEGLRAILPDDVKILVLDSNQNLSISTDEQLAELGLARVSTK